MRSTAPEAYSIERIFDDIRSRLPDDILVKVHRSKYYSQGLFRRLINILIASRFAADVNHVTGDVHYLTYLLPTNRTLLTVHDCGMLENNRGIKRLLIWFFWFWLPEKLCAEIVVISEATKQQLLKYLTCDPKKIRVIYNCVSDEFQPAIKQFNSNRPKLLQIGTKKNKNIERLVEAITGLNCDLVIIGNLSKTQTSILQKYDIHYENYAELSCDKLIDQYNLCDLVVFVSTYEGFGLPIVEANAIGRPVVTSNLLSMPEVAGNAACLVDPFNIKSMRDGILKIINNAEYRESLVQHGFENVKRFRTEYIAYQYAELYREIDQQA